MLRPAARPSFCEWRRSAIYYNVISGGVCRTKAGWGYPGPTSPFEIIRDHIAFDAAAIDACFVDDEGVVPQPGGFNGDGITSAVSDPFKGVLGSGFW
jgi:hypothetical protein